MPDKVMSADRAVELPRSGDRVWVHTGCATPEPLPEALVRRADTLRDVEILHMVAWATPPTRARNTPAGSVFNSLFRMALHL